MTQPADVGRVRSTTRKWLRIVAYNLAFGVVLISVARNISSDDVRATGEIESVGSLVAGVFFFIVFYALLAMAWLRTARLYSPSASGRVAMSFFASQLFKYLPTSVFTVSARVKYSRDVGMKTGEAVKAALLDIAYLVATGLVVWGLFGGSRLTVAVVVLSIAVAVAWWPNIYALASRLPFAGRVLPDVTPRRRDVGAIAALTTLGWLAAGVSLFLVARGYAVSNSEFDLYDGIAFNAVSYVASLLAVFAPAGLGVREALLLQANLPTHVVVSWRVVTTVVDVMVGVGALVAFAMMRRRAPDA